MKLKFSLNHRSIFNYLILLIIILNLPVLYYCYKFIKKQLYEVVVFDSSQIAPITKKDESDINLNKFNAIVDKLDKKSKLRNYDDIKNIFY